MRSLVIASVGSSGVMSFPESFAFKGIPAAKMSGDAKIMTLNDMSRQRQDKLVAKALRLLADGKTQAEVAKVCNVSLRTIQRWASPDSKAESRAEQLAIAADKAVRQSLSSVPIQEQINDLLNYRDSQRVLALQLGGLAMKLSRISERAIEGLEQRPEDVSPRLLPQYLRAIADLSERASTCWARSVGLDDLLEHLESVEDESQASA